MKIRYRVTREKPIDFAAHITPEFVANNTDLVARWLEAIRQTRIEAARKGGLATAGISTPAKRQSSRENGKLGGRPKKGSCEPEKGKL